MKNWMFSFILISAASLTVVSCAKKENDDLAKAQKCLDNVSQSHPAEAENCFAYAEKYTSQPANILKCSIKMTSGGLVESKVIAAYKALKDNAQTNKTAAYMTALSLDLDPANPEIGYGKAVAANEYCKASGVPGLIYISSVIVAGTAMNKVIVTLSGTPIDLDDPGAMNSAITDMLNKCNAASPDPACLTDVATMGQAVADVANSYCSNTNADQSVCSSINAAIGDGPKPTSDQVGQALFCYLQNHKYDMATQTCN